MMTWFKGLDLAGKAGMIFLAIVLAVTVVMTAIHFVDAAFDTAEKTGAVTERAAGHAKTLENVETSNAAKKRYRSDAAVRADDCLLDATNPADC